QLDKLRRGLRTQQLMGVVKGGASVDTGNLNKLEIVLRGTLSGGRIGIFEQVGYFLAGHLRLPVSVPGMRDALLGHLTKCLRHFHVRQVEFWDLKFRYAEVRHARRRVGVLRCLGFADANAGFCHDTHPLKDSSRPDPRARRPPRGSDVSTAMWRSNVYSVISRASSPAEFVALQHRGLFHSPETNPEIVGSTQQSRSHDSVHWAGTLA